MEIILTCWLELPGDGGGVNQDCGSILFLICCVFGATETSE